MNTAILHPEVQLYINNHLKSNIQKLILKGSPFEEIKVQELANQIVAKQKSEKKLPTWFFKENIYYPTKLSIEQTSSEETANYKASLLNGNSIIDITGGFGVDCYAFSKIFKKVVHCEINTDLSKIVNYNYKILEQSNIVTKTVNGIDFLKENNTKFDWIYIDPSRRSDIKGKVFLLNDCLPNVPENLELLFAKSDAILIKNSPILDISNTINELKFVKEIHVVALNNEVKELLFLLEKDYENNIRIKTVNILKEGFQEFSFVYNQPTEASYSLPLTFLYEPNAAILKSGGFLNLSKELRLDKIHKHSHLYTSREMKKFPGRTFKILHVIPFDKKQLKKYLPNLKANITTRNFPISVAEIRKKTKIKDGGHFYLFFTTNIEDKHIVIIAEKANISS